MSEDDTKELVRSCLDLAKDAVRLSRANVAVDREVGRMEGVVLKAALKDEIVLSERRLASFQAAHDQCRASRRRWDASYERFSRRLESLRSLLLRLCLSENLDGGEDDK